MLPWLALLVLSSLLSVNLTPTEPNPSLHTSLPLQALTDFDTAEEAKFGDMCSLYIARGGVRRLLGQSDQAAEDFRNAYELLDRGDKVCFCVCVSVCAPVYTCPNACRRRCVLQPHMADLFLMLFLSCLLGCNLYVV
jgi:hypothetical protein